MASSRPALAMRFCEFKIGTNFPLKGLAQGPFYVLLSEVFQC